MAKKVTFDKTQEPQGIFDRVKPLTLVFVSFIAVGVLMCAGMLASVYYWDSATTRILVKCAMIPIVLVFMVPFFGAIVGMVIGEEMLIQYINTNIGVNLTPKKFYSEDAPSAEEVDKDINTVHGGSPASNTRSKRRITGKKRR